MRTFLHKLMVDLTRHPREVITPVWSSSLVVNAFRVYEYWFGRREGIRWEGAQSGDRWVAGTWENTFACFEGKLRSFKNPLAFKIVPLPVLVTPDGQTYNHNAIFNFAIAFDNAAKIATGSNSTSLSGSYTVTGSNPLLLQAAWGDVTGTSSVTGMTYNAVAMTLVNHVQTPGDRWVDVYILPAPATGANTGAVSASGGMFALQGISYSGCAQTSQPDNSSTNTVTSSTTIVGTVTVNTANSWVVFFPFEGTLPFSASAGTFRYQSSGDPNPALSEGDSNGAQTTGSYSTTITMGVGNHCIVMVSIKPVASAAINSGFFFAAAS